MKPSIRALFDRVLAEYPGAVIAGGAVRDAVLDYPIRDIDIWIGLDDRPRITEPPEPNPDYDVVNDKVAARVTLEPDWSPYPLHIMLLGGATHADEDPDEILRGFDYGICMVAYTKEGLHFTSEFLRDQEDECFTLIDEAHTSPERYERLAEKFPGWQIDAPTGYDLDPDENDPI